MSVTTNPSSATSRHLIVLVLVLGLFTWLFSDVLLHDRNFVYRDASQFYYPLLKLVRQQWDSGHWPLWNPQENAGMPLLGNPASAVLYPPRIVIFQWLPLSYGAAYKWYILVHVLLCALSAWLLARHWKLSEFAAGLAAMSYAFAAAVMFQYCNVIFLVGAAWVPLGLLATDRMLEQGDWRWATALGVVLAMQVFGGDPEAAYVTGGLAAIYLMLLDVPAALAIADGLAAWLLVKWVRRHGFATPTGISDVALLICAALMLLGTALLAWRLRRHYSLKTPLSQQLPWRRRGCLAVAALVALGVSAVQLIPSYEFGRISNRAAGGVHYEPYSFWIAPWRLTEFLWPNVMGRAFPLQTRWLDIFPVNDKLWEPSLYFGVIPLVLAVSAWGVWRVSHWQRWLSLVLVLSLWGAMGPGGGLTWYLNARDRIAEKRGQAQSQDAAHAHPPRSGPNTQMETPAGGLYWVMLEMLPGFDTFRFPAKLLTFAAIAFALLGGAGWDRFFSGNTHFTRTIVIACTLVSLVLAGATLAARPWIVGWFDSSWMASGSTYSGPLQTKLAWQGIVAAFATTAILLGGSLALWRWGRGRLHDSWIAAITLVLVAIDIALANKWMVVTSDQSSIDAVPKLVEILRKAEQSEPSAEPNVPYRIHRMSVWSPPRWITRTSPNSAEETYLWEKLTIQPKQGLPFGVHYTINEGTLEPYDYWWFFAPFFSNATAEPRSIVYYMQRGFDMWGAKYFVLPYWVDKKDQNRGIITFLNRSTEIASSEDDDYQVRRNLDVYPRAWIVHQVIHRPPILDLARGVRSRRYAEMLYEGFDGLWREPDLEGHVQDPRRVVWIEHPDPARVLAMVDPNADREADRCRVLSYEPDRVEIEAETGARGILVFADLLYPGWNVEVDGEPSVILRANRMMRGVPLPPGKHRVVFQYQPLSVRIGAAVSAASVGLIFLVVAAAWMVRLTRSRLRG
jgi:hypothetical protein